MFYFTQPLPPSFTLQSIRSVLLSLLPADRWKSSKIKKGSPWLWPLWVWHLQTVWNSQLLKLFEFSPWLDLSNRFNLLNSHFSKSVWIFRCRVFMGKTKLYFCLPPPGRLELFWLPDCGALPCRTARGGSLRTFDAQILPSAQVRMQMSRWEEIQFFEGSLQSFANLPRFQIISWQQISINIIDISINQHNHHRHQGVQAGEVMEVAERHPDHHDEHCGRPLQPHLRPLHHHLHLRCDGHAALWQGLRQVGEKNETCWLNVDFAETERKKNLGCYECSIQRMTLMEVIMGMVMKRA